MTTDSGAVAAQLPSLLSIIVFESPEVEEKAAGLHRLLEQFTQP